ncbi:thiopeptide-type bacteriocin biosynthesis protein, partial [Streptomyces sp. NPDC005962]|uniref:lantibiotic dehydratase n=1 Tax=Streptomyces sp. NPDC005962 TaxID=3154466 RepID=UPI0033E1CD3B
GLSRSSRNNNVGIAVLLIPLISAVVYAISFLLPPAKTGRMMTRTRALQRGNVLLLRAAVAPFHVQHTRWPSPDDPAECRRWLAEVWADPGFATAVRAATPRLVGAVEQAVNDPTVSARKVRRAATATARYLLRATGRPTPFGLFAGVATAYCGPAMVRFGVEHRPVARPDTLWLDHVRRDIQGRPDVLPHLIVAADDLTVRRGDTLERPLPGGRTATVRLTRPLATILEMTAEPMPYQHVMERLIAMGGSTAQASRLLTAAVRTGLLTTQLHAPITDTDPLGHLLRELEPVTAHLEPETADVLQELNDVHRLLDSHHTTSDQSTAQEIRDTAERRMTAINDAGRVRLSVDLRLDATVQIPAPVLNEAEAAAHAMLRLTRHQGERPAWASYHSVFWDRYGAGTLVPVREAADLAAGVGLPAGFPTSLWPEPPTKALPRDELLMRRAWQAAVTGEREIRLTDADIEELSPASKSSSEEAAVAPHVEMGVRVYAKSQQALDRGDFTVSVRPAWSTGNLTGRFASTLPDSGLREAYGKLPTLVDGALAAQLSFTPVYPHAENVARTPAFLPYVIPLGEHRSPAADLIPLDDLAVLSTGKRLHLVSLSRRRVVEPVVLHPLALEKQAPPLARFLAQLGRGFATAWTQFDWGPLATGMPFLPRVRYRKALLTPAHWKLTASGLPARPFDRTWHEALTDWARTWKCPNSVELRENDRTLRLNLRESLHARLLFDHLRRHDTADLHEAAKEEDLGWIGHAHEIVLPLTSTRAPLPAPDIQDAPVVTNRTLSDPGGDQPWVQAKLFTAPAAMDQILARTLPGALERLDVWFVRYRSLLEENHLRLRFAAPDPAAHTTITQTIVRWARQLQDDALASRLAFDGYRPETGRYGIGAAMSAAEEVFIADSSTVRYALADLPSTDRRMLCALGMIDIALCLLGEDDGTHWMATNPAPGIGLPAVSRAVAQQTSTGLRTRPSGWTPRLDTASAIRRSALHHYRKHLADGQVTTVLESLLHMHHNRFIGPDRASEAACRHAARQACRTVWVRRADQ